VKSCACLPSKPRSWWLDQVPSGPLSRWNYRPDRKRGPYSTSPYSAWAIARDDFLLGRTLDALRGGYATVLRLSPSELIQTSRLLSMLLLPTAEQPPESREFMQLLPRRSQQVFERAAQIRPNPNCSRGGFKLCKLCAERAGLLAADDIATAVQVIGARCKAKKCDGAWRRVSQLPALSLVLGQARARCRASPVLPFGHLPRTYSDAPRTIALVICPHQKVFFCLDMAVVAVLTQERGRTGTWVPSSALS
jgi:hypothetical protein